MRLGLDKVTAQTGVGDMGEVYRPTDTSLTRSVAIKVLLALAIELVKGRTRAGVRERHFR
jgi:hypothetical protein